MYTIYSVELTGNVASIHMRVMLVSSRRIVLLQVTSIDFIHVHLTSKQQVTNIKTMEPEVIERS